MRIHYPLHIHLDGTMCVLVWYSNDQDGVFVDSDGKLPVFSSFASCLSHMSSLNITVEETDRFVLYHLDSIQQWTQRPVGAFDCNEFLNTWNLLDDVMASYGMGNSYRDEYREADDVYDKLFYGCNLPSITPEGEHCQPIWRETELYVMARVLEDGIALLRRKITLVS